MNPDAVVKPLNSVTIAKDDIVIVAGILSVKWNRPDDELWIPWLQSAAASGATVCFICTAAFGIATAGLIYENK